MTRELTFDELVVESQYLYVLKSQIGEITKMPRLVTAKCPRQMSCCQSLDAFSTAQSVSNAFGSIRRHWSSCSAHPDHLAAIGERSYF